MSASPAAVLPASTADFHNYAFANACLRVYTIVSLRDRVKKDEDSQKEASRGLHWEMAALFDHLQACKMYGPVPIPTAVVPMLRHYTGLYEINPQPTVDIHAFPFEFNEFMTSRVDIIQGNRWWDSLLEGNAASHEPQAQTTEQQGAGQAYVQNQADGNPAMPPTQGLDVPQGPHMSTSALNATNGTDQQPNNTTAPDSSAAHLTQTTNGGPANPTMSTAANSATPYFSVNTVVPADPNVQISTSNHAQRPNGSRFIPYNPPGAAGQVPVPQAGGSVSAPIVPRQAILAPPVKNPRSRRKSVKTNEFVDDEGNVSQGGSSSPTTQQEQQVGKENGVEGATADAPKKRPQDTVKASDFTKSHDGPEACANCIAHGRNCLTSKDARLKRCYECRVRQSKCVWPVTDGSAPATNGTASAVAAPDATGAAAFTPAPESQADASSSTAGASRPSNRFVAEVVVTPARRGKRKAPDAPSSAGSSSKRSMYLRSRGPPREEEEEDDPHTFEDRVAEAQGDDAYLRSKIALLVDMGRTAEMRLADVLGRVAELEAANRRMEKMIMAMGGAHSTSASPKRK